jgi:hypothetical protein
VVFSTNRTDRHDITEILLKGTFNTIKPNHPFTDGLLLLKRSKWLSSSLLLMFLYITTHYCKLVELEMSNSRWLNGNHIDVLV